MPSARFAACLIGCVALAACATLPDLTAGRAAVAATGPATELIPIDGILAQADAVGSAQAATGQVDARADRLRAKAARLRSQ